MIRNCTKCGQKIDFKNNSYCRKCNRIRCKYHKKKVKLEIFQWYGKTCRCCKESRLDFLTLDHIKDDGAREYIQPRHAKGSSTRGVGNTGGGHIFYYKLRNIGFDNRPLDLQVLCWNCQWGKRLNNGFCPHHPKINLTVRKKWELYR